MCCMCECENGKTNPYCLSGWELVLPPLGLCQSSWKLHGRHQEPGCGCALGNAPLGRCWCSVCAAAPLSILQLSSSIKANACSAFCIKANACSAFCCPGRAHLCRCSSPGLPARPQRAAPVPNPTEVPWHCQLSPPCPHTVPVPSPGAENLPLSTGYFPPCLVFHCPSLASWYLPPLWSCFFCLSCWLCLVLPGSVSLKLLLWGGSNNCRVKADPWSHSV